MENETQEDPAARIRRLEERIESLQARMWDEKSRADSATQQNKELRESRRRTHEQLMEARANLTTTRADLDRLADDKGLQLLQEEVEELRSEVKAELVRRAVWTDLSSRLRIANFKKARRIADLDQVMHNLSAAVETANRQRDAVADTSRKVVESLTAQRIRIAEQCKLWQRGDLDTVTALAGITAELNGHPLEEVGVWERKRAVREAQVRSELEAANNTIEHWERVEKEARDALVRVLETLGYGNPGLVTLVQAGKYDEIIAGLEKEANGG